MRPGIDPKVDYVFKRLFDREPTWALLVHLLNALLKPLPDKAIIDVELLNPFSEQDALDDKLSIVDVKARDKSGRLFHVEMQMLAGGAFRGRVLYCCGSRLAVSGWRNLPRRSEPLIRRAGLTPRRSPAIDGGAPICRCLRKVPIFPFLASARMVHFFNKMEESPRHRAVRLRAHQPLGRVSTVVKATWKLMLAVGLLTAGLSMPAPLHGA